MPSQSDNNIDDAAHARSAGSIGSEGFRAAFHIAASSRPAKSTTGPAGYVKAAKPHDKLNSQREFLFLNHQFGLPDAPYNLFPLYLPRPEYMEVAKESIEAIDPELANIDVRRIRDILSDDLMGPSMLQAAQKYEVRDLNLKEAHVLVRDPSCIGPTHVLVLHGKRVLTGSITQTQILTNFIPVHSLVLAANCAKLPPFPPSNERVTRNSDGREFILPVVPFYLSSRSCFPTLLEYLYRKSRPHLLARLFQTSENPSEFNAASARSALVDGPPPFLRQVLADESVLRDNACELGVYDDKFWETLDWVRQEVIKVVARRLGRMDTYELIVSNARALDQDDEPTGDGKEEEE